MASIRRTLSPVPHPGTLLNGEACSVASPLSKSSSCNQNYAPSGGLSSSFSSSNYAFYKVQAFLLGLFAQRSSRPPEKTKVKGQIWRRVIFQFLICFIVGFFVGLAPFVSMNLSKNLITKQHSFSFDVFPPVPINETTVADGQLETDNIPVESHTINGETGNRTSNDTVLPQLFDQDSYTVFHKLLIIVTPTYAHPFQAYYLNHLAQTLKLVPPPLLWIVVEMNSQSVETANTLRRTGVMYRHLVCSMNSTIKNWSLNQRNVALSHIEKHRLDGIIYFADDANIYSTELFEQMRQIRQFGTWTVAKLVPSKSQFALEGPICNGTQVIGWHTNDVRRRFRRFHAEMSGFAFNSTILWDPKRWHRPTLEPIRHLDTVKEGFQVSTFIEQVMEDESQMEGLPHDCSKVMVWHLHTESPIPYSYPSEWLTKNNLDANAPLVSTF